MSKKRLAEIIHKEAYLEGTNNLVMVINTDDYKWLIKQTERVQELENDNRVLKKVNVGSERAKERLRNWIDELEIENERYREALEFYADEETYETKFATDTDEICDSFTLIELDEGKKARKALEGDSDE